MVLLASRKECAGSVTDIKLSCGPWRRTSGRRLLFSGISRGLSSCSGCNWDHGRQGTACMALGTVAAREARTDCSPTEELGLHRPHQSRSVQRGSRRQHLQFGHGAAPHGCPRPVLRGRPRAPEERRHDEDQSLISADAARGSRAGSCTACCGSTVLGCRDRRADRAVFLRARCCAGAPRFGCGQQRAV